MSSRNAYESGEQKVIPAVLLYAFYNDRVLMLHRNLKDQDFHQGKWNGLGGKLEKGESSEECAIREFLEESGCQTTAEQWKWIGHLQFPNFKPHRNEDWSVTVYRCELQTFQINEILKMNQEGTLEWIPSSDLLSLNLWEGDRKFLPFVMNGTPFQGTFYYQDGKLSRFICNPIFN
jgi:8-oxo-dGTP diphosphatase